MDVMMPLLDGNETTRRILGLDFHAPGRADEALK